MAMEYKLSYTAAEIDNRLLKVVQLSEDTEKLVADTEKLTNDIKSKAEVVELTTDEYNALEETNANTLYMLTDGEEPEYALQDDVVNHIEDVNNPHGVTLPQLGVTATATEINILDGITATTAELNYIDGVTSNIQTQLNKKVNDFSIEIYNGTGGNPKPVRFASFNYSTCNSENGISAKISLVSGHGNGTFYAFLEDAIIRVNANGVVEVDNFKYYGAAVTDNGVARQYGDIFWLVDATNKIVDFYCLMGQYARVYQTPWKRLTYSSGGTVTQYTSCTTYSSGEKVWANNSDIALMSDIPTTAAQIGAPTVEEMNDAIAAIPTPDVSGQINAHANDGNAHSDIRNSVADHESRLSALESSAIGILSGTEEPSSSIGEDGDIYLVTD